LYRYREAPDGRHPARILASGMMMTDALEAQRVLAERYDVRAEVWSAPSYQQLRDDALACERWNRLHPTETPKTAYVAEQLPEDGGPVIAVTDFLKLVPEQVARFVPGPFVSLGTDGYGLSDTRAALRGYFEVDTAHIVVTTLHELAKVGAIASTVVEGAIRDFGLDPDAPRPSTL
jgi:pyruvate dehydrogenase E1 component